MSRSFAVSKEKVTRGVGLLKLLHFMKDTAQQTNRVLPLLVDGNIHYRILKLLHGANNQQWNMRGYLLYVPIVYGVWHAYKFVVTQFFPVFLPVLTYPRKDLLRPGSTILFFILAWRSPAEKKNIAPMRSSPKDSRICTKKDWNLPKVQSTFKTETMGCEQIHLLGNMWTWCEAM